MGKNKRRKSRNKKINPKFWVFCEGETEQVYVEFLRNKYRIPVKIITKVVGSKINKKIISSHIDKKEKHPKDKVFLVYDADVLSVLNKLKEINYAKLLASNPSIELWFLLHFKDQTAKITTGNCVKELNRLTQVHYKKGYLDNKLKELLFENKDKAIERSKKLELYKNPSTNFYEFIEELENAKKN